MYLPIAIFHLAWSSFLQAQYPAAAALVSSRSAMREAHATLDANTITINSLQRLATQGSCASCISDREDVSAAVEHRGWGDEKTKRGGKSVVICVICGEPYTAQVAPGSSIFYHPTSAASLLSLAKRTGFNYSEFAYPQSKTFIRMKAS